MANPRDVVVITRDRLQEVLDEAVRRGRITRGDATELLSELLTVPRDLARRVTGRVPIAGYDDLTAAEVVKQQQMIAEAEAKAKAAAAAKAAPATRTLATGTCSGGVA